MARCMRSSSFASGFEEGEGAISVVRAFGGSPGGSVGGRMRVSSPGSRSAADLRPLRRGAAGGRALAPASSRSCLPASVLERRSTSSASVASLAFASAFARAVSARSTSALARSRSARRVSSAASASRRLPLARRSPRRGPSPRRARASPFPSRGSERVEMNDRRRGGRNGGLHETRLEEERRGRG